MAHPSVLYHVQITKKIRESTQTTKESSQNEAEGGLVIKDRGQGEGGYEKAGVKLGLDILSDWDVGYAPRLKGPPQNEGGNTPKKHGYNPAGQD